MLDSSSCDFGGHTGVKDLEEMQSSIARVLDVVPWTIYET